MSSEALTAAISAIHEVKGPAAEGAAQTAAIQRLEESLQRSEETGALSAHAFEEAQIKAGKAEAAHARLALNSYEIQNSPESPGSTFQESLVRYWDDFSNRAQDMKLGGELSAAGAGNKSGAGAGRAAALRVGEKAKQEGAGDFGMAIRSLQKVFGFAIETSLVSNVSHQSTRTLNSLLRGQ